MPWKHIDINLLRTRLEELLTAGRGDRSQTGKPAQREASKNAWDVNLRYKLKNESWITSTQWYRSQTGSQGGMCTVFGCYATPVDSKYCAQHATTQRQGERMNEGKKPETSNGLKYDNEKPRMALLSPKGIEAEAEAMTYGAEKYGDYNWRNGIKVSRYLSAALRHIFAVLRGEFFDPESGLHHLGHAKANLGMALQTLEDRPELNDLYVKEPK